MKNHLLAAFAALVIGTAAVTTVLSEERPVTTRLGFLDMQKAFESYRKHKDAMDQIRKRSDDFLGQLKTRAAQIDQSADKLTTMNPGTDEFTQLERKISQEKFAIDWDRKQKLRDLETDQRRKRAMIYKEICQEAQAYGQERGLAAVLLYIPPETEFGQDLDIMVSTRAVLCRDDQLDVTADVVARLNAQLPPPAAAPVPAEK